MHPQRPPARRGYRLPLALTAAAALALTGCASAADADPAAPETQESQSATSTHDAPETAAEAGPGAGDAGDAGASLPDSFPSEVPLLTYDVTDLRVRDEAREYRVQMTGADMQADADEARAQFADAGFTEVTWNDAREGSWSGLFEREDLVVTLSLRQQGNDVAIEYNVGRH